jgi:transcriptional regulator with XRE-family HTH domain
MNASTPHEMTRKYLASNLKRLRIANNLSTVEVAQMLGKSRQGYINYENETREIGILDLTTLADYYNVPVDELIQSPFLCRKNTELRFRTFTLEGGQLEAAEQPIKISSINDDIVIVKYDDFKIDFFWKTQKYHKNHVMLFNYYDKPYVSKIYYNSDRSGFFLIGEEHIGFNKAQSENLVMKGIHAGTLTKNFVVSHFF